MPTFIFGRRQIYFHICARTQKLSRTERAAKETARAALPDRAKPCRGSRVERPIDPSGPLCRGSRVERPIDPSGPFFWLCLGGLLCKRGHEAGKHSLTVVFVAKREYRPRTIRKRRLSTNTTSVLSSQTKVKPLTSSTICLNNDIES